MTDTPAAPAAAAPAGEGGGVAAGRRRVVAHLLLVEDAVGDDDHQISGMHEMGCGAVDPDDAGTALAEIKTLQTERSRSAAK